MQAIKAISGVVDQKKKKKKGGVSPTPRFLRDLLAVPSVPLLPVTASSVTGLTVVPPRRRLVRVATPPGFARPFLPLALLAEVPLAFFRPRGILGPNLTSRISGSRKEPSSPPCFKWRSR